MPHTWAPVGQGKNLIRSSGYSDKLLRFLTTYTQERGQHVAEEEEAS